MTFELFIKLEAEQDLLNAVTWYNSKRKGLGNEFILSVEACLNQIKRNPDLFQIQYRNLRRAFLRRFPFAVFYLVENDKIYILAVHHTRMDEINWKKRMD